MTNVIRGGRLLATSTIADATERRGTGGGDGRRGHRAAPGLRAWPPALERGTDRFLRPTPYGPPSGEVGAGTGRPTAHFRKFAQLPYATVRPPMRAGGSRPTARAEASSSCSGNHATTPYNSQDAMRSAGVPAEASIGLLAKSCSYPMQLS